MMTIKRNKLKSIGSWIGLIFLLALAGAGCGGGSNSGRVVPATITTQPTNQSVSAGSAANFSVVASGDAPLSYQWKRDGIEIVGATSATYSLSSTQVSDIKSTWSVVVRNAAGSVTSNEVKLRFTNLDLLAGSMGGAGNIDGVGAAARFASQGGMAVDSTGNLYLADTLNSVIRKITPAGLVTTLAGTAGTLGSVDGNGAAARFSFPTGVAVDSAANVYVADTGNYTIRKITPAGTVTTLAGTAGIHASLDGIGETAGFTFPTSLAVDSKGNVYVVEIDHVWHYGSIRKITPSGIVTTLLAPRIDVLYSPNRLHRPGGIAVDSAGNLYVTDTNNTIRKITSEGVTDFAGTSGDTGSSDGIGAAARFNNPKGVTADRAGNVYVTDSSNYTIRKITPDGAVTTLAGAAGIVGTLDGIGVAATFNSLGGLTVDDTGNIYVADKNTIRKITPAAVVTTVAGNVQITGSLDGTGASASFNNPTGVAVDGTGNVYVTDTGSNTIRKITSAGVATTFTGVAGITGSTDGIGAAARFYSPSGVAVDGAGNVYVADSHNYAIRKITPTGVVTKLAGGNYGSADGIAAVAGFNYPIGVAVDGTGNVYVADVNNHTIRKISAAGVVTTLAGTAGVTGSTDGLGAAARFFSPNSVAVDAMGNIYVADTHNRTIRKITANGVVTTLAGGVAGSADGVGATASFSFPQGVAVDRAGNVYVADGVDQEELVVNAIPWIHWIRSGNNTIRKITPTGVVTTVVGKAGLAGIALGNLPGSLSNPIGLAIDTNDVLYVTSGNAVLKIQL